MSDLILFLAEGVDEEGHPGPEVGEEQKSEEDEDGADGEHIHLRLVLHEHVERHDAADVEEHGARHFAQTEDVDAGLLFLRQMAIVADHPIAFAHEDDDGAAEEENAERGAE